LGMVNDAEIKNAHYSVEHVPIVCSFLLFIVKISLDLDGYGCISVKIGIALWCGMNYDNRLQI